MKYMNNVYNYLKNLITDEYVIVGVSGGPDSMALLTILSKVSNRVVCAHINHNVRTESKDEEKFVKEYCNKIGVVFESVTIKNYTDNNFHQQAREFRYNYFEDLIKKYQAKYLFTAHHGDDLIETILMRIVRGSTLKGYSGFDKEVTKKDYKIIRPFIELSKDEIINFNQENDIPYVIDCSNEKDIYTRNRFRKVILPFLKQEDVNIVKKFNCYSETLSKYDQYIRKIALNKKEKIYNNLVIDIELFNQEDLVIKEEILYLIFEELYKENLVKVSDKHIQLLLELITSSKANSLIYLPNRLKAIKSYGMIVFEFGDVNLSSYEFELTDKINLANGNNIEIISKSEVDDNNICRLNLEEIKLPLYVRTRHNGDKMEVKKLDGHKKINDIFIDNKISTKDRNLWPVVTDSTGLIVWLPGLKKSKFDKTKEEKYDIILRYY